MSGSKIFVHFTWNGERDQHLPTNCGFLFFKLSKTVLKGMECSSTGGVWQWNKQRVKASCQTVQVFGVALHRGMSIYNRIVILL